MATKAEKHAEANRKFFEYVVLFSLTVQGLVPISSHP